MLSRGWIMAGGLLALGAMLFYAFPGFLGGVPLWIVAGGLIAVAAIALKGRKSTGGTPGERWLSRGEFLCDDCKYNHPDTCSRPERPNATRCPDYRSRG